MNIKFYEQEKTQITIVDDIMGSGKTSWAIQFMNNAPKSKKFLFVTPFLDEITRVKEAVKKRILHEPNTISGKGRKREHLKILLDQGKDIVTTHELFKTLDKEALILLRLQNYTLIMDEVVDMIELIDISKDDAKMVLNGNAVADDKKVVNWINHDYYGRFKDVEAMTELKTIHFHEDDENPLVWLFPIQILKEFAEVYVLTYMFESQIQSYYFKLHLLDYDKKSVENKRNSYCLIPFNKRSNNRLMELIIIEEGKKNNVGKVKRNSSIGFDQLTFTKLKQYRSESLPIRILKKNLENFFRHKTKGGVQYNMWTTIKDAEKKLKGKGYTKGCFVPHNTRATNDFGHKTACAYVFNRYMHPSLVNFLKGEGIEVDQDGYALSELLQWLFRSAIRNGHSINLYIPSERMRTLLKQWLNDEPITFKGSKSASKKVS